MLVWSLVAIGIFAALVAAFFIIAKKGRKLRKLAPLPPPAKSAYLRWNEGNATTEVEITAPFYIGMGSDNNVQMKNARVQFEACIFYHQQRFAIQTLDGGWGVEINGEDVLAGYLRDGDVIRIGTEEFYFRCV